MFYLKEICILEPLHQSSSAARMIDIQFKFLWTKKWSGNCWSKKSNHSHILSCLQSRHFLPQRWDSQTFDLLGMSWRSILFGQWTEGRDKTHFGDAQKQQKINSYRRPIRGPEKLLVCFLVPKEESSRKSPAKEKGEENDKPRVAHNQQSPPGPTSISPPFHL